MDEITNYNFYTENFTFSANTLKINLRVADWPFKAILNTLDVEMDNVISREENDNDDCATLNTYSESDGAGSLQWIKISLSDIVAYPTNN